MTIVTVGTSGVSHELSLEIIQARLNQTFHLLFLTVLAFLLEIDTGDPELNFDRSESERTSLI